MNNVNEESCRDSEHGVQRLVGRCEAPDGKPLHADSMSSARVGRDRCPECRSIRLYHWKKYSRLVCLCCGWGEGTGKRSNDRKGGAERPANAKALGMDDRQTTLTTKENQNEQ